MNQKWALTGVLLVSGAAEAHGGHSPASYLLGGFLHPWLGWDHVLAMLTVGLWAARHDAAVPVRAPALFVTLLLTGLLCGVSAPPLVGVEVGIAVSILVLGLMLAGALRLPRGAAYGLLGMFAFLHGIAHAVELSAHEHVVQYGVGMVLATLLLHGAGYMGGRYAIEAGWTMRSWRLVGLLLSSVGLAGVGLRLV